MDLLSIAARQLRHAGSARIGTPCVAARPGACAMPDDDDDGLSPISLRINASVTVSGSNSIVCLAQAPADHANAIAQAVVKALRDSSSGHCGIPMIDDEGRPRPVRIEVDAALAVEGDHNVVGSEHVVGQVARQSGRLLKRSRDEAETEAEDEASPSKRRR